MSLEAIVAGARRWLLQKHIKISDEWISACTEFVLDEQNLLGRGYALTTQQVANLHNEIFQQWLHADLKEIGSGSLPSRLSLQENPDPSYRDKLDAGKYAVQLEWIIDVATPAYTQLMKISGAENENENVAAFPEPRFQASWEPKKKRMMKFELHDGSRSVYGMEWKPIKKLHEKMRPGLKLLLVGPVNIVRGGTLFLTDANVEVIGGDVDSMGGDDGVDPLAARLGSRLNLRGNELKKRFPNLGKRSVNKVEPLEDVTNTTLATPVAANNQRTSGGGNSTLGRGGGGGGGGAAAGVSDVRAKSESKNQVKTEPKTVVKTEPKSSGGASAKSGNSNWNSSGTKAVAVKTENQSASTSSSRPLKTSQKSAVKTERPFQPPTSPAPSTSKGRSHSTSSSLTPPTPTQHKAVLNDLFGVSQSPSQPFAAAKSSGGAGDDDFDDEFDGDDDLFDKLKAIEQEAAADSQQQPHRPEIETTLSYHPSTQQVVSTSVKLHNFSGELDISHDGGIKVSASPRPSSPTALSASRGMAFANAALKTSKSSAKGSNPPSGSSSAGSGAQSSSSSSSARPWTPNQPPRAFQHDPLFSEDEEAANLSQLRKTSPLKAKRKSDATSEDAVAKRAKTESKKQIATVRPSVSEPPIKKAVSSSKQPSVSEVFPASNQHCSPSNRPSTSQSSAKKEILPSQKSSDFDFQFDAFDSDELDLEGKEEEGNGKEGKADPAFRYLNEFAEWSKKDTRERSGDFVSKCFIVTFLGKFKSDANSGFHIDVKITDGVSTLGVRIADPVCAGFLGFSANEYLNWRSDKMTHRERLFEANKKLVDFNQMLMHVSCLFKLETLAKPVTSSSSLDHLDAVVVELRDFGVEDLLRLKDEGKKTK